MEKKVDSRELIVGEFGTFSASSGTRGKDTVEIGIERLAPGIYRVTPTTSLLPGEYCFFYGGGGATLGVGGGATGKLFDFGVD
jgi:hypothetical protein